MNIKFLDLNNILKIFFLNDFLLENVFYIYEFSSSFFVKKEFFSIIDKLCVDYYDIYFERFIFKYNMLNLSAFNKLDSF